MINDLIHNLFCTDLPRFMHFQKKNQKMGRWVANSSKALKRLKGCTMLYPSSNTHGSGKNRMSPRPGHFLTFPLQAHRFTFHQNDNMLWERVVFEVVLPANCPVSINKSPSAANHSHQFASPAMRPSTHKLVVGNWCCRCRKIGSLMGSNKFTCSKRRWKTTGKWNGTKNRGWFKRAKGNMTKNRSNLYILSPRCVLCISFCWILPTLPSLIQRCCMTWPLSNVCR